MSYKYYYIYIVTNSVNNKKYIGLHKTNNLKDGYLGSGRILNRAFKKYGRKKFIKEIIEYCDNDEDLKNREIYWIAYYNASENPNFYNKTKGGESKNGDKLSESSRKQISEKLKIYFKNNPDAIEKLKLAHKGRKQSKESIEKQLQSRKIKKSNYKSITSYHKDGTIENFDSLNSVYNKYGRIVSQIYRKGYIFYKNILFIYDYKGITKDEAISMLLPYRNLSNFRKIKVINLTNNTSEVFFSVREFCRDKGYSYSSAMSAIHKNRIFKKIYKIETLKKTEKIENSEPKPVENEK